MVQVPDKILTESVPDKDHKVNLWFCLLLVMLSYLLYLNSFHNAWLLDDFPVLVNNPDIQSFGNFLKDSYPGRPLRELTFLVDYQLFGLEPFGYHFQSILWHGINSCLVFLLAQQLGVSRGPALLGSLFFLCHPIQVEVVANISHRKDSLALCFCLLSILSYLKALAQETIHWRWLILAVTSALVALLAKQNAIVMLAVFLLAEWMLRPRQKILLRSPFIPAAGIFSGIVAALFFLLRGGIESHAQKIVPLLVKFNVFPDWSEATYFQTVFKSWAFLFAQFLWPTNLAVEYTYAVPDSWTDSWVLSGVVVALLLAIALLLVAKHLPVAGFGIGWLLIFWLPTANLWPVSYFAADRYWYAPSAGIAILTCALLHQFWQHWKLTVPLCLGLIIILSCLTWQQNKVWRDDLALWTQAVKVSPTAPFALNNLGNVYYKRGENQKALHYFEAVNAINTNIITNQLNLALAYEKEGNKSSAMMHYLRFLEMNRMSGKYPREAQKVKKRLREKYGYNVR
jgi:tetratricopeptide (TPR) repeat protein